MYGVQEVLDRVVVLKKIGMMNVGVLDSRVSKIMALMGFKQEEGGKYHIW